MSSEYFFDECRWTAEAVLHFRHKSKRCLGNHYGIHSPHMMKTRKVALGFSENGKNGDIGTLGR